MNRQNDSGARAAPRVIVVGDHDPEPTGDFYKARAESEAAKFYASKTAAQVRRALIDKLKGKNK